MSLLLDDVSIVVTPNGYKAGTLYGVLPTYAEGSELAVRTENTNQAFKFHEYPNNTVTYDVGNTIITYVDDSGGGYAYFNSSYAIPTNLVVGVRYKISITFKVNTGNVKFRIWDGVSSLYTQETSSTSFITETVYMTAQSTTGCFIKIDSIGTGQVVTISDMSVKEVTSSDMDVTRATAATRVDEDGLVNYAVASDLVTNGDFATDSDWTEGAGWDINTTTNVAERSGETGNSAMSQSISLVNGKLYKFSYTRNYISGNGVTNIYSKLDNVSYSTFGDYTSTVVEEHTVTGTFVAGFTGSMSLNVYGIGTFTGNFDNISVKELTDVPRIDYTGGGCPHILAEPERTNLIPYSEDFSSWTTTSATLTPNQLSPDGTNNAYIVEDDNATGSGYEKVDETITTTATPCTLSVFIKKKTSAVSSYSGIQMGTGFSYLIFDSYNGTYNQSSNTNYDSIEVENFNTDWWRLKLTGTVTTSTRVALWGAISTNGTTISPTATGSETFWGAQLEQASYATSYIPNFGTSAGVTRNQDIFTRDGIGSLINSPEGVLFVEISALADGGENRRISLSDGSNDNRVVIYFNTSNNLSVLVRVDIGGTPTSSFSYTHGTDIKESLKVGLKWKQDDFALWVNGDEVSTGTGDSFTADTLNMFSFADGNGSSLPFLGKVKQLQVYDTALTDEQLLQLTGESGTDFYESYAEMATALTYTIQ